MNEFWQSLDELLNRQLFSLGGWTLSLHRALSFILILAVAFALSIFFQRMVDLAFRRREIQDEGTQAVVKRLLHYLILLIGLGVGLETVGVELTALFTAGAVFAVAIGFAMQTILQNFVAGVILLIERSIKPGDILDVEGMRVKVVTMGIRTTVARTLDEEDLILPNSLLSQSIVKNFTLRDTLYRVRVPVGVSYGSDMRQVFEILKSASSGLPGVGYDREPVGTVDRIRELLGQLRGFGLDQQFMGLSTDRVEAQREYLVGSEKSQHHHRVPPVGRAFRSAGGKVPAGSGRNSFSSRLNDASWCPGAGQIL